MIRHIWKISFSLILIGISSTIFFLFAMTTNLGPLLPALVVLGLVLGPYLVMGILVWLVRSDHVKSVVLFLVVLALVGVGVYSYAMDYQRFLNRDPNDPGGSNWMPFLLAMGHWLITFCLAAVFLPAFFLKRKSTAVEKTKDF